MTTSPPLVKTEQPEGRGNRVRWWALGAVLAAVVLVTLVFGSQLADDQGFADSPLIGQAVGDIELDMLETADGFRLIEQLGQVTVINFWASWCVPCRAEHTVFLDVAEDFADRDLVVVGITYQDRPEDSIAFLDSLGRAQNGVYAIDPEGRAAIEFGVFGIPETFVVAEDGTIVSKIVGRVTGPRLRAAVTEALATR